LALAFSADSTLLAASTWEGRISVWRLSDQEKLQTFNARLQSAEQLAFSTDGTQLYAWAPKESVQVWGLEDGQSLDEVYIAKDGRGYLPTSGHFDQTGTLFAANYEHGVRILRMRNGTTLRQITDLQTPVRAVVISPDSTSLAALQQGNANVWNLDTGALTSTLTLPENEQILFLTFLEDDQSLITLGSSLQRWQIEEMSSGAALTPVVHSEFEYQTSITASSKVTSEEQLILLNNDGSLQSYDLNQGTLSMLYPAQNGEFTSHALFTQNLAALGTQSGTIIVTGSTGQKYTLNGAGGGPIRSLAFSTDASLLASGGDDGTVLVWSLSEQQVAFRLDPEEPPQALLFTSGNEFLVIRTRSGIQVWSLEKEAQTLSLPGSGMALSGDGIILAAADPLADPAAIQLYRLPSGEPFSSVPLVGNELALSPDHMILAVAGRDLTLWSVIDGSLLQRVPDLKISGSLQFSQDGKWIILTSWDGSTRVWGIPES
jgi:WD40 repeat protein